MCGKVRENILWVWEKEVCWHYEWRYGKVRFLEWRLELAASAIWRLEMIM